MIFDRLETQILGISVDSVFAARAVAKELELTAFPLLGDLGGKVCRTYGVLRGEGFSERVTFLVDREGMIRYRALSDLDRERSIMDYVMAIEALGED